MKNRIFSSIFLLTIVSLVVACIALSAVFYLQVSQAMQMEVRERTAIIKDTVTDTGNFDPFIIPDMRLTLIAPDGAVLYDNEQAADTLANHTDREEVNEALEFGNGESLRFSDTLGQETYYYAVKLENGSVLRLAKTTSSIWGMLGGAVPVVFIVVLIMFAISYFLAGSLTKRIVNPINKVRIDEDLSPPYDELAHFVKAIEEQREQIKHQLSDLQNRSHTIDAIMDSMSEGIILVNKKGSILSLNKSAADIFSVFDSVEGQSILEILRDVELNESMRQALSGIRGELNLIHNEKTYRVYFSPVTDSGAIILFLDITEKSMAEKIRREFSANVSHELKTPLTTIYGNAEMLEGNMVKESDKALFYEKIKTEAARMITLIEDIIMLSRLDENTGEIVTQNIDLKAVAIDVIESLEAKAKEQNVTVSVSGGGVFPANPSQMAELFHNLIDNAIKYNKPEGTVEIEICVSEVQATIIVSDTGIGIPEDEQDRVFERFYRVDKSRSKKTGGTGLGLAIVKHIVLAYDGSVELKSDVDKGTSVKVTL